MAKNPALQQVASIELHARPSLIKCHHLQREARQMAGYKTRYGRQRYINIFKSAELQMES